jgi:limonene-1,2-epoxide hydrolase
MEGTRTARQKFVRGSHEPHRVEPREGLSVRAMSLKRARAAHRSALSSAKSPATSPAPASDPASPLAVVESFLRALEEKRLDDALALLDDAVVYQNVPFPAGRGKAAVTRTLTFFQRFITDFKVTMHNIAARDGVVLTERVDILSGPLTYMDIWVCGTFEVHDGKITLWRDYFDLAEATTKFLMGPVRRLLRGAA